MESFQQHQILFVTHWCSGYGYIFNFHVAQRFWRYGWCVSHGTVKHAKHVRFLKSLACEILNTESFNKESLPANFLSLRLFENNFWKGFIEIAQTRSRLPHFELTATIHIPSNLKVPIL